MMEQAYEELYREFLRLRWICLKQAALLHHLVAQQKVAPAPNADPRGPGAIPVLCKEEKRDPTTEDWAQAMARLLPSAGQTGASTAAAGDDYIARGTDRPWLSTAHPGTENHRAAATGLPVPPGLNRGPAPPDGPGDTLRPEEQLREVFYKAVGGINDFDAGDGTTRKRKPLWMFSSFLDSEMLSQVGGLMMSEVALQSQECEFCHAVFPGNTTTRGDFLRHLTAHIS